MMNGYLCNKCGQLRGFLDFLRTGVLTGNEYQLEKVQAHFSPMPGKPCHGILYETGLRAYEARGRQMADSGIVELGQNERINVYYNFDQPVGRVEFSGIGSVDSSLGKMVLATDPIHIHWFVSTGYASVSGYCAQCGQLLFGTAN